MSKRTKTYSVERKRARKGSKWVLWDGPLDSKEEANRILIIRVPQYPKSFFRIKVVNL